jgi:hypothetical protein
MKLTLLHLWVALCITLAMPSLLQASPLESSLQAIAWKMSCDLDEVSNLMGEIRFAPLKRLDGLAGQLNRMKVKADIYCQAQQEYIAMDDSLMNLMATYYEVWQQADDSVSHQKIRLQAQADYEKAERFILKQDTALQRFHKQAAMYAKLPQTAAQLENVKGQELLLMTDIESRFAIARDAVEKNPSLKRKLTKLEQAYLKQKALSDETQAMAYKSPIEQAKDYLLSLAAVGIILMFVNMVASKIQLYKQTRDSAKKMEEALRKANGDYPQI